MRARSCPSGYNASSERATQAARITTTTSQAYAEALTTLAERAYEASPAGEACARVLLSTFDAWQWGFTAADLARLDPRSLEAALVVLRCRAHLGPPPDGAEASETTASAYFEALARHWRPATPMPTGNTGGYP